MRRIQTACLLLAVALSTTSALTQQELGKLRIIVTDPSGAVVPGAKVRIIAAAGSDQTGNTNEKGLFITDLAPGDYDIFVSFQVFSPVARKLRLTAKRTTTYSVKLKFDPLTKFVEVQ